MTNEELLVKARDGCKLSEEQLYKQTEKLIKKVAKKLHYINSKAELADLYSLARIGWVNAYIGYDATRNVKFSSYAYRLAKQEILQHFISLNRTKRNDYKINFLSLNSEHVDGKFNGQENLTNSELLDLPNNYGDHDKKLNELVLKSELNKAIKSLIEENSLTEQHVHILIEHLVREKSGTEIGNEHGFSRQRVNQIIKMTKCKIKRKIEENKYNFELLIS